MYVLFLLVGIIILIFSALSVGDLTMLVVILNSTGDSLKIVPVRSTANAFSKIAPFIMAPDRLAP